MTAGQGLGLALFAVVLAVVVVALNRMNRPRE